VNLAKEFGRRCSSQELKKWKKKKKSNWREGATEMFRKMQAIFH